ncbi:Uncharacterised protein [Raoultella terrigena]|uniref:Uncharacterized protein n=1 Tax=Raoultella terrigena TaxID=577 RepID=A0A4U9D287_RAOTE|nr:Uncharacterised protein [Raoultella terrigena]
MISLLAALFHTCISLFVLLVAFVLFNGYLHWTIVFLPLVFFPASHLLSWLIVDPRLIGRFPARCQPDYGDYTTS